MIQGISVAMIALSSLLALPKAVEWQADYGKALSSTRSTDQPLLIVLDVPNDPKSSMESKLGSEEKEQLDLLNRYQRCHIDVTTEYGKRVAKAFGATKFPFTAIIDKTGSIILCKKLGQLSDAQWNEILATYQKGEKLQGGILHTSFFRGDGTLDTSGSISVSSSRSNCPSCQRKAQGL
jgi:hypothetical protein